MNKASKARMALAALAVVGALSSCSNDERDADSFDYPDHPESFALKVSFGLSYLGNGFYCQQVLASVIQDPTITVANGAGRIIGTNTQTPGGQEHCSRTATITVPDSTIYVLGFGNGQRFTYSKTQLINKNWTVGILNG